MYCYFPVIRLVKFYGSAARRNGYRILTSFTTTDEELGVSDTHDRRLVAHKATCKRTQKLSTMV